MNPANAMGLPPVLPSHIDQIKQRYGLNRTANAAAFAGHIIDGGNMIPLIDHPHATALIETIVTGLAFGSGLHTSNLNGLESRPWANYAPGKVAQFRELLPLVAPTTVAVPARSGAVVKPQPYRVLDAAWQDERVRVVQELNCRAAKADLETDDEKNLAQVAI